ncbi:hypothetical protein VF21_09710 [Pseudogymnoascus sp. 05NY08]|nr:hypothetical protein VF21_09710 [Pseudogymnoascus sp. 05NY08]
MPRGRPKKYATAEEAAAGRLARNRESYQRRQESKKEEEETPSQSILQFTPLFQPTTTIASSSDDVPAPAPLAITKKGVENNTGKDVSRLQEALGGLNLQSQVNKDDEEAAAILQELQQSEEDQPTIQPTIQPTRTTRSASATATAITKEDLVQDEEDEWQPQYNDDEEPQIKGETWESSSSSQVGSEGDGDSDGVGSSNGSSN